MNLKNINIGIIGLGYVGLPLAVEFAKKHKVVGFDTNSQRVKQLVGGEDITNEVNIKELMLVLNATNTNKKNGLKLSSNFKDLKSCNIFIVTVPTPINKFKSPDLEPLLYASKMIGQLLKKGDLVIYESTVYPGCTEEECVPVLEKNSNLIFNKDFFCGYSPERINPGDKVKTLTKIIKVTSGSNDEVSDFVNDLYLSIIEAGTHKASSIKVAEASKSIENAQRDLNISFVNELALIFDRINIDTTEVLDAAATKWNFLNFKPGLVGGHCISVDPYYLTHKAESLGYYPQVIHSGRRINDQMGAFVANKLVKLMVKSGLQLIKSKILILGFAFKENCSDIRNSKVIDIYNELKEFGVEVDIHDYLVDPEIAKKEFDINLISTFDKYNAIILAVPHEKYLKIDYNALKVDSKAVIFDIKAVLDKNISDIRL
ncbi:nucleotide sugar dehydrogenase [Flavobacteriaceae bacterium]|nr:nucleotide sugar dehydrogenase [Flavobacteriaceae bacterium]